MNIADRLRQLSAAGKLRLPLPGHGQTALRHRCLAQIARQDLGLARLAEAHTDAVAILAEAGREPQPGFYGVWAAETPGSPLLWEHGTLSGAKMFCSGAGLLDRALVTAGKLLLDIDLREHAAFLRIDASGWKTAAFAETNTATVAFLQTPAPESCIVGTDNWYLERPGFWHGACGPAACWAGGAAGLYDYAAAQSRNDPHTMAHLAAMHADVWGLWALLEQAGLEIDHSPGDRQAAPICALSLRHLVEQSACDILRRLGRAYGPRVLAFDAATSQRCQELELYIRQSHAERDLEMLGRLLSRGPGHQF